MKKFGWAEEAFEKDGVKVEWTLSQGSNKALEFFDVKSHEMIYIGDDLIRDKASQEVGIKFFLSNDFWAARTPMM